MAHLIPAIRNGLHSCKIHVVNSVSTRESLEKPCVISCKVLQDSCTRDQISKGKKSDYKSNYKSDYKESNHYKIRQKDWSARWMISGKYEEELRRRTRKGIRFKKALDPLGFGRHGLHWEGIEKGIKFKKKALRRQPSQTDLRKAAIYLQIVWMPITWLKIPMCGPLWTIRWIARRLFVVRCRSCG